MISRLYLVPFCVALTAFTLGWGAGQGFAQSSADPQVQAPAQPPQEGSDPQPATLEKQQALQDRVNRITNADRQAAAARAAAARAAASAQEAATPDAAPAPSAEGEPQ